MSFVRKTAATLCAKCQSANCRDFHVIMPQIRADQSTLQIVLLFSPSVWNGIAAVCGLMALLGDNIYDREPDCVHYCFPTNLKDLCCASL